MELRTPTKSGKDLDDFVKPMACVEFLDAAEMRGDLELSNLDPDFLRNLEQHSDAREVKLKCAFFMSTLASNVSRHFEQFLAVWGSERPVAARVLLQLLTCDFGLPSEQAIAVAQLMGMVNKFVFQEETCWAMTPRAAMGMGFLCGVPSEKLKNESKTNKDSGGSARLLKALHDVLLLELEFLQTIAECDVLSKLGAYGLKMTSQCLVYHLDRFWSMQSEPVIRSLNTDINDSNYAFLWRAVFPRPR